MGDKTREEVETNTLQRDAALSEWCRQVNANLNQPNYATYITKTDCHDFSVSKLKQYFYTQPHLASLITNYPTNLTITIEDVLNCNENLTFIAVLQGLADPTLNLKPLFLREDNGDWMRTDEASKDVIMTKDYLTYLRREFNFQIKSIFTIFFYKKCLTFNSVFQNLIDLRAHPQISSCRKQLLKKIINYSTGFFGFNQNKGGHSSHRIVSKINNGYDITRHALTILESIENNNYYIKTTFKRPTLHPKTCVSPLPIYCFIVEYGKMRMSQFLTFFDYFMVPASYRHLYSNTDNLIIALSTDTIEEAVKPHLQDWFGIEKSFIFSDKEPGHLEQEFYFGKELEWKFVSPVMQNYSIITKDSIGLHKSSVFSKICSLRSYQYSLELLKRQSVTFSQPRRTQKIVNTDTHEQTFVIKLKQ